MTIHQVNPNVRDPIIRRNFEALRLSMTDIDGDMMRLSVYDAGEDGYVDTDAGGVGIDISAAPVGSVLVANTEGVWSTSAGSAEGQVLTRQGDGTVAWQSGVFATDIVATEDGLVVLTESDLYVCTIGA